MVRPSIVILLLLAGVAPRAFASTCEATVESNDAMQFTTRSLVVPAGCDRFTVVLRHAGKLPATTMGHNFVLGRTADIAGIVADGMKAGATAGFVKRGDARVIAATPVIGGGATTSVTFATTRLRAGESYTFVCTFPGHAPIMRVRVPRGN